MEDQAAYITRARIEAKLSLVYVKPRSEVHVPEDPTRWDDRCGEFVEVFRNQGEPSFAEMAIKIEETVAECVGVSVLQMHNYKWRKREVVTARQYMMTVYNKVFQLSSAEAAGKYNKDHATCLHARKQIRERIETELSFYEDMLPAVELMQSYGLKLPHWLCDAPKPKKHRF